MVSASRIKRFQKKIWGYYRKHSRNLPWRKTRNPYRILVSEIMLQQTQVERVREKYHPFIKQFPSFASLAEAPLKDVLAVWKGLGYNRRAIVLKQIAERVISHYDGMLPSSIDELIKFRGIGKATAGAIAAFAFNQPTVFIETNIRRVFLHDFFHDRTNVADLELLPLVEKSVDQSNPREWYYALMDYGTMLKKEIMNPNRRSLHYQRQTPFEGSQRQLRGFILSELLAFSKVTELSIISKCKKERQEVQNVLEQLRREGFIRKEKNTYSIA